MADEHDVPTESVTRRVDLEAGLDEVWAAIADPELRAAWLDDADAARRTMRVDAVDTGHRLVWTWWRSDGDDGRGRGHGGHGDDGGDAGDRSTVEIALRPLDGGGTRVVVTETLAAPGRLQARASVPAPFRAPVARAWDHRLLGLELLFVAAGACVL